MKVIRILNTVFATGAGGYSEPVMPAGSVYPEGHAEAERQLVMGNAEKVDAPDDAAKAELAAAAAEKAADKAAERADEARAAAELAAAAAAAAPKAAAE